tara:strand:+ start:722 stop:913 length:192 start_codon:yes stop_codon:yes gene_type:complete
MTFIIFIVGFVIFMTYVLFFMFNKKEEEKQERIKVDDNIDYDGHGNWGRFPPVKEKKKKTFFK